MNKLPDLLRQILRDFCHVEWWEVDELAEIIERGAANFDVSLLREQINSICESGDIPFNEINSVTSNEFESGEEARNWLMDIQGRIFG